MNIGVSLAFLAVGIVLTIFGVSEMSSYTSDISRMMTGAPTGRAIWMVVGGVAFAVLGIAGLVPVLRKKMIAWM